MVTWVAARGRWRAAFNFAGHTHFFGYFSDERGAAVVYMICEPSTHYYQIMTRSPRMPVLIDEKI